LRREIEYFEGICLDISTLRDSFAMHIAALSLRC